MSLRHLFVGIMVGVFAMALGSNPAPHPTDVAIPGAVIADKTQNSGAGTKTASKSDDRQPARQPEPGTREASSKNEKPVAPERTWAQRLVFPAGNKF